MVESPTTFAFLRQAAPEEPCSVVRWDSAVVWEVRSSSWDLESYPAVALCRFRPPWEEGKRRLKLYSAADQLGRLCSRVVDCPEKGLLQLFKGRRESVH